MTQITVVCVVKMVSVARFENAGPSLPNRDGPSCARRLTSRVTSSAETTFVVSFEEENVDCLGESNQPAIQ
jgi:hypothetical protein